MSLIANLKIYFINVVLSIVIAYLIIRTFQWTTGALAIIALVLGVYTALWLVSWAYDRAHFKKVYKIVALFAYFIKELFLASIKVAYEIVTPHFLLKPGIVAFPLSAKTDLEITLLANILSLTPGTLSMAISEDRKIMYIHSLYVTDDKQPIIDEIKNGFERRILEIVR